MLTLCKWMIALQEMHAYLMVAEAVDSCNKESLKRNNVFEVLYICMMSFPKINTHRLSREEYSTIATACHGLMKQKDRKNNDLPLPFNDKPQKYYH